jgi:imidazolonepropionase-like amidohydrolase
LITLNKREVIEDGTLLITGNKIKCVGDCDVSGADKIMDLAGKTLIPGFIDVHAHGFGGGSPLVGEIHSSSAMYLAYGVTTVLDPSVDRNYAFTVAELVYSGRVPGPRVYATGNTTMPRSPFTGPQNYAEAEAKIHANASMGAISTKIYLSPRRDQRQMFVEASRKFGMTATNEAADLLSNIASVLDGSAGLEHAFNLAPTYKDVAQFFAQTKTIISSTIGVNTPDPTPEQYFRSRTNTWLLPKDRRFMPWSQLAKNIDPTQSPITEYSFPIFSEAIKDLLRAGGYASIGGHGQHYGLDSHWEVWAYASAVDNIEALEMASLGGAQMIGMENELGSLEVGKIADLMILDANPLEDIQNTSKIHAVLKGGVLYDDETLDQIWPQSVKRAIPAWVEPYVFLDDTKSVGHWDNK